MRSASRFAIVLVTAPELKTARKIARAALEARLVACANLIPRIESHYWWGGRLEQAAEVLMVMKARRTRLKDLEQIVLQQHPYDTPEVLSLPLDASSAKYLAWLGSSTVDRGRGARRRASVRSIA